MRRPRMPFTNEKNIFQPINGTQELQRNLNEINYIEKPYRGER